MSKKVFIGVGHGGNDPGAVANGLKEKDINLVMALAMKEELERHGVQVGISRTTDSTIGLAGEVSRCNVFAPDLAVECHNNAGGGKGFEVWVQSAAVLTARSEAIAKVIEKYVIAIGQNSRGLKCRTQDNGTDYFGWLRQLTCPAVLCEGAFLDNAADVQMINSEAKQRAFGVAYAKGVLDYLGITWQPVQPETAALTRIMGKSVATAAQLRAFLLLRNLSAPDYADIYIREGEKEGVRGDIAFAQSCLETGSWRFGGDVKPEQNNFCGLGATGGGEPGCCFATPEEGVRVQIQHLKAYACADPLAGECVDPRFKYVTRGCAPYVEWLGIPDNPQGKGWAAGKDYGKKILGILGEICSIQATEGNDKLATLRDEVEVLRDRNMRLQAEVDRLIRGIRDVINSYLA